MLVPSSGKTLADSLLRSLSQPPGDLTFLEEPGVATLTRSAFVELVLKQRERLIQTPIRPGTRLFVQAGRGILYWVDLVAVWSVGAVPMPLDPLLSDIQQKILQEKTGTRWLLGGEINATHDGWHGIPALEDHLDNKKTFADLPETEEAEGAILFTSGTTGAPKCVRLSQRALLGNARSTVALLPLHSGDRLFMAIPFHFTSALCHFLAAGLTKATLVCSERRLFQADLAQMVMTSQPTCFGGSPLQVRWLAQTAKECAVPLNWILSSGDHLSKEVLALCHTHLPKTKIFVFYGLTEVGGRFCCQKIEQNHPLKEGVGFPIKQMRVTIRDEQGLLLPAETVGEVYAEGDFLFTEYLQDTQETAKTLTEHGVRTGDSGWLDSQGVLHLQGRLDDVFKSAGKKVSTRIICDALLALGEFADVAVLPVEDALLGMVPWAFIVPNDPSIYSKGRILQQLRRSLPSNHIPKALHMVAALPRTGSGKLDRRRMAEMVQDFSTKNDEAENLPKVLIVSS
ncbi:MAG: acyl--CoA ligase [Magnetococcus sp. DMHC-6]